MDTEEVWSMLLKLRPFVLQQEPHYFHRVNNILKRQLLHPAFRMHLDAIDALFSLRGMQADIRLQGPGRPPLSNVVVMDWLNSLEYHQDKAKRKAVMADLGLFGTAQNGLPVMFFALVDMIKGVFSLADLVETLAQVAKGTRTEIQCSAEWHKEA